MKRILTLHHVQATVTGQDIGEANVFCPGRLLDQVAAHLIENVFKHRIPGRRPRLHVEYAPRDRSSVQMVLRNSGTRPVARPGQGLKAIDDKLRPFGAALTSEAKTDGEWTFEAVVTMPLWYGR